MMKHQQRGAMTRRAFIGQVGLTGMTLGLVGRAGTSRAAEAPRDAGGAVIPGFEKTRTAPDAAKGWQPFSDRKIRVGIVAHQSALKDGELLKIPQYELREKE